MISEVTFDPTRSPILGVCEHFLFSKVFSKMPPSGCMYPGTDTLLSAHGPEPLPIGTKINRVLRLSQIYHPKLKFLKSVEICSSYRITKKKVARTTYYYYYYYN